MPYVEIEEEYLSPMDYVDEEDFIRQGFDPGQEEFGGEEMERSMDFSEMMEYCVVPTSKDAIGHVGKVLFWAIVFRILSQNGKTPPWAFHVLSSITGVFVISHFFHTNIVYVMGLLVLSYVTLILVHRHRYKHRGPFLVFLCIMYNATCELGIAPPMDWHQIRGAQMILSMKIISLGFDMDAFIPPKKETSEDAEPSSIQEKDGENKRSKKERRRRTDKASVPSSTSSVVPPPSIDLSAVPSFIQMAGYALNPGNSIFGPWVKYEDYLNLHRSPTWNLGWILKILFSMATSFVFLSISTCWNSWMIKDGSGKWLLAYRDAMSFRASHYFVSFVSEATATAAGFGYSKEDQSWSELAVARCNSIELPRSLVEVVVSWNIPMHKWLKTYIFKTSRSFGTFTAVLSTYIASAFLHGFNFQLGTVLLSLGFYTYVEHGFRRKLADIFDASIEARSPSESNSRKHSEKEFLVILVNLAFGLLAHFHLAYLGVMFGQSNPMEEEGYSWRHTLSKWRHLGFLSHYVIAFTYSISFLL
eukprot:TRINITY_DN18215_c0_g1_i1.p1 TRINITY_DN18215_c0_g1~~TRINITY_DN18215_c0_g1_i1.p1  ORF type:complete len:530 (-),score=109.98 TRINITY_DN18215_c0_g1_i1:55-1644(-)